MEDNYLKDIWNITTYNFKSLLSFEFLYKLIIGLIFVPFSILVFNLAMKLTGFNYLTSDNIIIFMSNPITIILLLLIIIFLIMIMIFDITTLIIMFDKSYHKKKIGLMDSIRISLNKCINIFKFKNVLVVLLILFFIPFLNIGFVFNAIISIKIPVIINAMVLVIYLILLLFLFRWLFAFHYMVIENKSFEEARKSSKKLIKGNCFNDKMNILLFQLIVALIYTLFLLTLYLINSLFGINNTLITIIWILIVVFGIISNIISCAVISSMYYKHKIDSKENMVQIKYEEKNKALKYVILFFILLAILGGKLFNYQIVTGKSNLNIEFMRSIEITAHRGASFDCPENTMAAFKKAKELGADWIELDVQQTKDKQIVVSHDTNLSRVAGVDMNIIDMTYDEIKDLDVGSFFGYEFKDEKIPLLKEVIKYAKGNNIRLNIELKATGHEDNFEKQVVDLINEYNFKDRCVIASQTYSILENIKKYDKDVKTVYVVDTMIGNIAVIPNVDIFSIELSNVTIDEVRRIHNAGKELYVWTVNSEEDINNMINMNVDNIITEDVKLSKSIIKKFNSKIRLNS